MSKLKLLICYHKPAPLFKDNILTPIHVGRAVARKKMDPQSDNYKWLMDNLIGDDTGENISEKNSSYNEMTSLYWAWKNYDQLGNPEYIGMMHYRRHFVFHEGKKGELRFDKFDQSNYYDQINYSEEKAEQFVEGLDYVVHMGTVDNVYKHYTDSHKKEDLDEAIAIVKELHPEYSEICDEYFAGNDSNFCNMFILKKELFFEYCEFVFSVLEEFEKRVDLSEKRLFISERVTGIFFAKLLKNKDLKYKIVPISYIDAPIPVEIALIKKEESLYPIAVSLTSILSSKKDESIYNISIVSDCELSDYQKTVLLRCKKPYENVNLSFATKNTEESYIECIEKTFNNKKKCLVLSDYTLVLNDLSDFFPTVSADDYFIVGGPKYGFNEKSVKEITDDAMVLNLGQVRAKKLYQPNGIHSGYMAQYYITVATDETKEGTIFDPWRSRQRVIDDSSWKRILFYNSWTPWDNPQEPLSYYWWEIAKKLPVTIKFPRAFGDQLIVRLNNQQKQVNEKVYGGDGETSQLTNSYDSSQTIEASQSETPYEEWRDYSMLGKLKFYYDHNGLKQTIIYCGKKYIRR